MKVKIRSSKDFYSGLVFIFFGLLALVMSRNYPMGSAMRMGPGYFPTILGGLLVLLGLVIAVRTLWLKYEEIKPWAARPLLMVLLSVVAFALIIQPLGLVLATLALVVISCLGGLEFRIRDIVILYLLLAALTTGLFVWGVGLPIKVWPI